MDEQKEFSRSMLRSYDENIFYNLFDSDDIKGLRETIKFGEGLVIKDNKIASQYETNTSLFNANSYINAVDNHEGSRGTRLSELERTSIVKGYKEGNPYYVYLKTNFGVPPLEARKTKDYHIMKTMNNTLNDRDRSVFFECYYDMLEYFNKVTSTSAFDNQTFIREYYINYIIFGTILRFITRKMETYFDVDEYTEMDLKNGFISWGMDHFDEIPLQYQRRIYKGLNDLIRVKGTDEALSIINDLFSYQHIDINKYILTKIQDSTQYEPEDELGLFKVPFNENLDTNEHELVDYENITKEDPYWRSTDEEILNVEFNRINTKYISADVNIDLSSSSKELSYFMNLLNDAELIERDLTKKHINSGSKSKKEAKEEFGILDSNFYFNNSDISQSPIYLFDAMVALNLLVFNQMNYDDRIHRVNFVKGIYGYSFNHDFVDDIKEIRNYLYWNKSDFPRNKWDEYMRFFSSYRLKTISRYEQIDIDTIMDEYESNIRYFNQLLYVSELAEEANHSSTINDYVKEHAIYNAIELLVNTMMDPKRNLPLDILFMYTDLHSLLSKFMDYQMDTGLFPKEKTLTGFRDNSTLRKELSDFKGRVNDRELTIFVDGYLKKSEPTTEDVELLIDRLLNYLYKCPEVEKKHLTFTKNLYVYLTIFTYKQDPNMDNNKITFQDFISIFNYNEKIREQLGTYMSEEDDPLLFEKMELLWNSSFISDYDMSNFKPNKTLKSYLAQHDPNLYKYTEVHIPVYDFQGDKMFLYRDKVFELVESIDNFMNMHESMLSKNNFIGMSEFIRRYIRILLEIFKAYTLQVIDTRITYTFNDNVDNKIHLRDQMIMSGIGLFMTDELSPIDTMGIISNLELGLDTINVTDEIKMTIIEHED